MFESYAGREKLVYENQRVAATGVPFIFTCKAQTHCAAIAYISIRLHASCALSVGKTSSCDGSRRVTAAFEWFAFARATSGAPTSCSSTSERPLTTSKSSIMCFMFISYLMLTFVTAMTASIRRHSSLSFLCTATATVSDCYTAQCTVQFWRYTYAYLRVFCFKSI